MSQPPVSTDILIIGSGNAGLSAALSAAETNPAVRITVIDKCSESWAGGNTYFTAGAFRTTHEGLPTLLPLVNNTTPAQASRIDMDPYTAADFTRDLNRMTGNRTNPALSAALVKDSQSAITWLASHGIRFQLSFNRQAYEVANRIKFWGGLSLKTEDGGKGLVADELAAVKKAGVEVFYNTPATGLLTSISASTGEVTVTGAQVLSAGHAQTITASAVILAAGGFEANPQLRAQHLGPGWDKAFVRGTPYNTGEMLRIAQREVNAKAAGQWSGCHSVAWDANASAEGGDRGVSNEYTKSGYPLGIMVNLSGERFVDEGSDMRNYTYAMVGRRILEQAGGVAFQVWDGRTIGWLREEEYRGEIVRRIEGDTIEELAWKCGELGLDGGSFLKTVKEYNASVEGNGEGWDPAVKDGLCTKGLAVPKSNWALPIDQPPFLAVRVTTGVTFTFGGLAVDPETAGVVSEVTNEVIPGLYCVGEMLGGIFYDNYPGGSGLTAGTVFGCRAGRAAAERIGL